MVTETKHQQRYAGANLAIVLDLVTAATCIVLPFLVAWITLIVIERSRRATQGGL